MVVDRKSVGRMAFVNALFRPITYKSGLNQKYYTVTLILLIRIVLCSKFTWRQLEVEFESIRKMLV